MHHVVINRDLHANAGYCPPTDFKFASSSHLVPVVVAELPTVIQYMTLAFQQFTTGGQTRFMLVAIQSYEPNQNLFLRPDGQWLLGYKPAFYREFPFALQPTNNSNELQMAIHEKWFRENPSESEQKFFVNGELTKHMQAAAKFLSETMKSRIECIAHCRSLYESGVITPWDIPFKGFDDNGSATNLTLKGLYHINKKALQELPADKAALLNQSGALEVAYAQLLSEARLKDLSELQDVNRRLREDVSAKDAKASEVNLEKLFGESDDLFSF